MNAAHFTAVEQRLGVALDNLQETGGEAVVIDALTALIDERIEKAKAQTESESACAKALVECPVPFTTIDAIEDRAMDVTIENLRIVREQKAKMMVLLERAYDIIVGRSFERAYDIIACGSFEHGSDAERDSTQWVSDYENLGGNMKDSNG